MSVSRIGLKKFLGAFPILERNERLDLVYQLEQNAQVNIDFIMMMVFSISLASLGLSADFTAVVIGAMLVAPLRGPLVAAGHSLVHVNCGDSSNTWKTLNFCKCRHLTNYQL